MKEMAGNRWCSTCRFRPPVKKFPTTPPQLADVRTCSDRGHVPIIVCEKCANNQCYCSHRI